MATNKKFHWKKGKDDGYLGLKDHDAGARELNGAVPGINGVGNIITRRA